MRFWRECSYGHGHGLYGTHCGGVVFAGGVMWEEGCRCVVESGVGMEGGIKYY